jgi:hypothetical protein
MESAFRRRASRAIRAGAHELGGHEHVAGESPLKLAPPGVQADVELGVECVQPSRHEAQALLSFRSWRKYR